MAIASGNFVIEKNENLIELAVAHGLSEEQAKAYNTAKSTLEVTVDGNNYTIKTDTNHFKFTPGAEFDDKQPNGEVLKAVATIEGNKVVMNGKKADGSKAGTRVFEFTATGVIQIITPFPVTVVCKRFYVKA